MLDWKSREVKCGGSALFRGNMPPLLENFPQLAASGVSIRRLEPKPNSHWSAELEHPTWGAATAVCLRNFAKVPRVVVEFDPRLSKTDRQNALEAGSAVSLVMAGKKKDVLADRKLLLRYLRCLLGDDGLIAVDHGAHKFWSRESLDNELSHDADVDIDSLFITHMVYENGSDEKQGGKNRNVYWAHTHGLAELGGFDFDILRPSPVLVGYGYDIFRAISYLILEEKVGPGTDRFAVILPRGEVCFASIEEFNRRGTPQDRTLRGDPKDEVHNQRRLVLCEPRSKTFLSRVFPSRLRPSKLLSIVKEEDAIIRFTRDATSLMEDRAHKTIDVLQQLAEEFAEFKVNTLVKLGYRIDQGQPNDREHLWFVVHRFLGSSVDATLVNSPRSISRMKNGDRAEHSLDLLSDWTIVTPAGSITPRDMLRARILRDNAELLRRAIREPHKQVSPADGGTQS